eukprot:3778915-Prymnesium_polylepis.1
MNLRPRVRVAAVPRTVSFPYNIFTVRCFTPTRVGLAYDASLVRCMCVCPLRVLLVAECRLSRPFPLRMPLCRVPCIHVPRFVSKHPRGLVA